jgi:hypothetical protein
LTMSFHAPYALVFGLVWMVFLQPAALAEWAMVGVTSVPVDRVVTHLERRLAREPRNADVHANLARLHAQSFALGRRNVLQDPKGNPVFEYERDWVPAPSTGVSKGSSDDRRSELYVAIKHYQNALRLAPAHLVARIGLAWCFEQDPSRGNAIDEYRRALADAWRAEKDLPRSGFRFVPFITEEAASRLIALLDPQVDAKEIAAAKARVADVTVGHARAITPIAVPLETTWTPAQPSPTVVFDADGSGIPKRWSWISPGAGWLVYDPLQRGEIHSALQFFGSVTYWLFWSNGYEALCTLDDNDDGVLTGGELAGLAIWRDEDIDGQSDPGEVLPITAYRITKLSCTRERSRANNRRFAAYSPEGATLANGTTRPTYDLILWKSPDDSN